jgi:hypothetical protein
MADRRVLRRAVLTVDVPCSYAQHRFHPEPAEADSDIGPVRGCKTC